MRNLPLLTHTLRSATGNNSVQSKSLRIKIVLSAFVLRVVLLRLRRGYLLTVCCRSRRENADTTANGQFSSETGNTWCDSVCLREKKHRCFVSWVAAKRRVSLHFRSKATSPLKQVMNNILLTERNILVSLEVRETIM